MTTLITKNCLICKSLFTSRLADHKRGGAKFCSRKCFGIHKSHQMSGKLKPNTKCAYCQKPLYRNKSKLSASKSGLHFCCNEHKNIAQRIESSFSEMRPDHYKNGVNGYRTKAIHHYGPHCQVCNYTNIQEILVVHHKDENHTNNHIDNLQVLCPNCHDEIHFKASSGRFTGCARATFAH